MTTKTVNITYWIATIIFAALMIFSAVGGLQPSQQAIQIFHDGLGYPIYFIQYISFAKLLGVIAILIPGLNKTIKEWAYAGLIFDLIGAMYCNYASGKTTGEWLPIIIFVALGFLSYYLYHKKSASLK